MPISKFKFVSPGVQIAEIDNSQLPAIPAEIGPVIIGRAERGPSLRPVKVGSFSEFVEIFGSPKGGGQGTDVWRNGGEGLAPTYGAYAAQAYLRNSNAVTFVRLLGRQHSSATTAGKAGWRVGNFATSGSREGGAYGLFVVKHENAATGTLGAIFYTDSGCALRLRGNDPHSSSLEVSGACKLIKQNAQNVWQMDIMTVGSAGDSTAPTETISFDLSNENSRNYARKVFNTNPTLTNTDITPSGPSRKKYWLGETYLRDYTDASVGTRPLGLLLPLMSGSGNQQSNHLRNSSKAETPWIISQDVGGASGSYDYQKLFKFVTHEPGEWEQQNFKMSVTNVKSSDDPFNLYGSFTVELRMAKDSDNAKEIVERYSNCNMNPNSNNYVAKKIGDMYAVWSDTERKYREYGNHTNQSRYFRISMNSDVDNGSTNESYLPFGFEGPLRFKGFVVGGGVDSATGIDARGVFSGSNGVSASISNMNFRGGIGSNRELFVSGAGVTPDSFQSRGGIADAPTPIRDVLLTRTDFSLLSKSVGGPGSTNIGVLTTQTCSFNFPTIPRRANTIAGRLGSPQDAYFGIDTTRGSSNRFEESYADLVRGFPASFNTYGDTSLGVFELPYKFTLEDLTYNTSSADALSLTGNTIATSSTDAYYISGSRGYGRSISMTGSNTWSTVLAKGFDSFTLPFHGGFDGLDITEADPFRNAGIGSDATELTKYAFNSIKMAVDTCADPEVVECNMMTMPGLTHTALTEHIIKTCEDRADALAIIDIESGYLPPAENSDGEEDRAGNIDNAVSNLSKRGLNSSYGCCYYPWIQARDSETGKSFWCPPSVAAIGTFSSAQNKSELWFAPAGFNRGGLTVGSAGIPVTNVKQRLTSKERDKLYEVNINPIASFPAEGIVIFGQKTLQTTPSALDRINVRRLMIHVKKEISRIAALLLFDQNVQSTWDRFTGQVRPFLESIKTRLGLSDYKVVLDETTTTPDLIDRNIMYAKIFLKPARAIEFIAIDFVITSTGASFED